MSAERTQAREAVAASRAEGRRWAVLCMVKCQVVDITIQPSTAGGREADDRGRQDAEQDPAELKGVSPVYGQVAAADRVGDRDGAPDENSPFEAERGDAPKDGSKGEKLRREEEHEPEEAQGGSQGAGLGAVPLF